MALKNVRNFIFRFFKKISINFLSLFGVDMKYFIIALLLKCKNTKKYPYLPNN